MREEVFVQYLYLSCISYYGRMFGSVREGVLKFQGRGVEEFVAKKMRPWSGERACSLREEVLVQCLYSFRIPYCGGGRKV